MGIYLETCLDTSAASKTQVRPAAREGKQNGYMHANSRVS